MQPNQIRTVEVLDDNDNAIAVGGSSAIGEPVDMARFARALAAPFAPEDVQWRPQGRLQPGKKCQVLAYLSARTVQDRLDAVCGVLGWSFDWTPIATNAKGELVTVKGTLTIAGVSKSDVGEASNFAASKGAISSAFKRCAVQFGIGRYLYELRAVMVVLDAQGHIGEATLTALQTALARRFPG